MSSQWLAVGAETDPLRRARQLQRSWERLLADRALAPELPPGATAGLRPTIVESWRRSLATGLDPTDLLAPIEVDEPEVLGRWFEHPLGSLNDVLMEQLRKVAEESRGMVVVTDASGLVLHRVGDESLKERADEMNLVEGARYSEAADGTNGIGTALAADHPFQVFAFEHFNERHHQWICSGAPVHDPVSGQTVGLIDLSSLWKIAHPRSLELVTTAARTIEEGLMDARRDRDARLRCRYSDFMTRSTDLLVDRDGYVLAGAEPARSKPIDIPEDGGEVVLGDGSVAVAAALGQSEAYLLRRVTTHHAKSAPVEVLDRAEKHVRELVAEQSALRQVATLVARESAPDQLFGAVAEQVARVFAVPHVRLVRYEPEGSVVVGGFSEGDRELFPIGSRWPLDTPGVMATVRQTGRPARVEDYAHVTGEAAALARAAGLRSAVASPIVVERRLWGAMVVYSLRHEPFPESTEARLTDFTELVATAIANAESRQALAKLAEEQAALRRVATIAAGESSPVEVFGAVTEEAARVLGTEAVGMLRFEPDGTAKLVAQSKTPWDPPPLGTGFTLEGENLVAAVHRTGEAARTDDWSIATGSVAAMAQVLGVRSAVAAPIVVEGCLWGTLLAATSQTERLPEDTESRIGEFTELVATAISNAESREALGLLADEQAALRRVAELVAGGIKPEEVFRAVSAEVGVLFGSDVSAIVRFEGDGMATVLGDLGGPHVAGKRVSLDPGYVVHEVRETSRSARFDIDDPSAAGKSSLVHSLGIRSAVASPIVVEGELWGAITAASLDGPLAHGAEQRLNEFTGLLATAIANTQAREQVTTLAEEQAALRRVATLVAQGVPPEAIFSAVGEEIGRLFGSSLTMVGRFEPDAPELVVVGAGTGGEGIPVGSRWELDDLPVSRRVFRTGRSVRVDEVDYSAARGPLAAIGRRLGVVSTAASPIFVEGRLWGVVSVSYDKQLPPEAEERLEKFSELIATAIGNAESSAELAASRRRIVAASDDARRRIERNLHDGTQQRLVSLGLAVRAAEANLAPDRQDVQDQLSRVATGLAHAVEDLQEISRGIHPAILSRGGLGPALQTLAHRSAIPVDLEITMDVRLAEPIEVAAYFVASEALANAAKHSDATRIDVSLERRDANLLLSVRDDGVGGVDAGRGSGIVGLNDRVEALGGSLRVDSSPGEGTQIVAQLPLDLELERPI
jgi:GAF domain-containing protein